MPRRALHGEPGQEGGQRHREIIGIALLQAERARPDVEHELEEPGARERRRRDDRNRQRRKRRGIGGDALLRRMGRGERHFPLLVSGYCRGIAWAFSCRGAPQSIPRGLTGADLPLYSAGFAPPRPKSRCPEAPVAELVDALDSKSSSARSAGSIPARGTKVRSCAWRGQAYFYRSEGCRAEALAKAGDTIPDEFRFSACLWRWHTRARPPTASP